MKVIEPSSLIEATDAVRGSDGAAKYLSGGTALVLLVSMGMLSPETVVSLRRIRDVAGWDRIEIGDGVLRIGGGVTMSEVARNRLVQRHAYALAEAASVVGNVRIRNAATLGGLLAEADYASDPPAVLVALEAQVVMHDGRVERRLPAQEFILDFFTTALDEAEIVTAVELPLEGRSPIRSRYLKFASRSEEDRPCVGVAAVVTLADGVARDVRLAVGAVSGRPQLFEDVMEPLSGRSLEEWQERDIDEIGTAYAERIDPIDDVRGSQWYRREVTGVQVARALRALAESAGR